MARTVTRVEIGDERALAVTLFNQCWEYLERDELSDDDAAALLGAAFTSRHHWLAVGGERQAITADWMVSRAAARVGFGDLAVFFALRAQVATTRGEFPDWMVASCAEGVARAYASRGERELCAEWTARAEALVAVIVEDGERELIASQLATVPR